MLYIIQIFNFYVKSYWLISILAIIISGAIFFKEAKRNQWTKREIYQYYLGVITVSVISARVFFISLNSPLFYLKNPVNIFSFSQIYWKGGVSIYGFVLGALLFTTLFSYKKKMSFWNIADVATPSLIAGISLRKVGCFLNGCCYGKPTDLFWGVIFSDPLVWAPKGIKLHPVQLYEAGANFLLFLHFWKKRRKIKFAGELTLKYAISYNILRFFLEFFKHPNFHYKNSPFTISQAFAIGFCLLSIFLFKSRKSLN